MVSKPERITEEQAYLEYAITGSFVTFVSDDGESYFVSPLAMYKEIDKPKEEVRHG